MILLALLLLGTTDTLAPGNAVKNALLGVANAVAALASRCSGRSTGWRSSRWPSACSSAGRLGPVVVRHAPAGGLRA